MNVNEDSIMKAFRVLHGAAVMMLCAPLWAQSPTLKESPDQPTAQADAQRPASWNKVLTDRAKRGTLHDEFQNVRGDTGKWSDEPSVLHAPSPNQRPAKTTLDDWFDRLLEGEDWQATGSEDNWLLLRTRQLDDNDRLWVERVERRGNQFTIVLNEAIWQGRYSKTFTFYHVYGVNLGKLEPGKYEAKWIIKPLTFKQFEGDGRPTSPGTGRQIDNWPKDESPAEKKPVELLTTFNVVAEPRPTP